MASCWALLMTSDSTRNWRFWGKRFNIQLKKQAVATYVLDVAQRPIDHRILEGAHDGVVYGGSVVWSANRLIMNMHGTYLGYQKTGKAKFQSERVVCCSKLRWVVRDRQVSAASTSKWGS